MKTPPIKDFEANFKSERWRETAEIICQKHNLSFKQLQRAEQAKASFF